MSLAKYLTSNDGFVKFKGTTVSIMVNPSPNKSATPTQEMVNEFNGKKLYVYFKDVGCGINTEVKKATVLGRILSLDCASSEYSTRSLRNKGLKEDTRYTATVNLYNPLYPWGYIGIVGSTAAGLGIIYLIYRAKRR